MIILDKAGVVITVHLLIQQNLDHLLLLLWVSLRDKLLKESEQKWIYKKNYKKVREQFDNSRLNYKDIDYKKTIAEIRKVVEKGKIKDLSLVILQVDHHLLLHLLLQVAKYQKNKAELKIILTFRLKPGV